MIRQFLSIVFSIVLCYQVVSAGSIRPPFDMVKENAITNGVLQNGWNVFEVGKVIIKADEALVVDVAFAYVEENKCAAIILTFVDKSQTHIVYDTETNRMGIFLVFNGVVLNSWPIGIEEGCNLGFMIFRALNSRVQI